MFSFLLHLQRGANEEAMFRDRREVPQNRVGGVLEPRERTGDMLEKVSWPASEHFGMIPD